MIFSLDRLLDIRITVFFLVIEALLAVPSGKVENLDVFTEQLKYLADNGDLLIGISGSGTSKNILSAFKYARHLSLVGFH